MSAAIYWHRSTPFSVRYMFPLGGATFNSSGTFYVHWDDDEGTSRIVTLQLIVLGETSSGEFFPLDSVVAVSVSSNSILCRYYQIVRKKYRSMKWNVTHKLGLDRLA